MHIRIMEESSKDCMGMGQTILPAYILHACHTAMETMHTTSRFGHEDLHGQNVLSLFISHVTFCNKASASVIRLVRGCPVSCVPDALAKTMSDRLAATPWPEPAAGGESAPLASIAS